MTLTVGECELHQFFSERRVSGKAHAGGGSEWVCLSDAELSCISQMGWGEKHTPWEDPPPPPLPWKAALFLFVRPFYSKSGRDFTGARLNHPGVIRMIWCFSRRWLCDSSSERHQVFASTQCGIIVTLSAVRSHGLPCLCMSLPQNDLSVFLQLMTQQALASGGFEAKYKAERKKNWASKGKLCT